MRAGDTMVPSWSLSVELDWGDRDFEVLDLSRLRGTSYRGLNKAQSSDIVTCINLRSGLPETSSDADGGVPSARFLFNSTRVRSSSSIPLAMSGLDAIEPPSSMVIIAVSCSSVNVFINAYGCVLVKGVLLKAPLFSPWPPFGHVLQLIWRKLLY